MKKLIPLIFLMSACGPVPPKDGPTPGCTPTTVIEIQQPSPEPSAVPSPEPSVEPSATPSPESDETECTRTKFGVNIKIKGKKPKLIININRCREEE